MPAYDVLMKLTVQSVCVMQTAREDVYMYSMCRLPPPLQLPLCPRYDLFWHRLCNPTFKYSMYCKCSMQRLITVLKLSPWPTWPCAKETSLITREQTPGWCNTYPQGNEVLTVLCQHRTYATFLLFHHLVLSFFHHFFSLYLLLFLFIVIFQRFPHFMGAWMNPKPQAGKAAQPWSCSAEERNCKAALIMSPWIF